MATFLGDDDTVACVVVKNTTGRYSIWSPDRSVPEGWVKTGFAGTRAECLRHIEQVWPDPTAVPVSADATS